MSYQKIPSYGRIRPRPLAVVYPESTRSAPRANFQTRQTTYATRPVRARQPMPVFQPRYQSQRLASSKQSPKFKLTFFKTPLFAVFAVALVGFIVFRSLSGTHNVAQAITAGAALSEAKQLLDSTPSPAAKAAAEKEARMQTYKDTVSQLIAAQSNKTITVSTADVSGDQAPVTVGDQGSFTAASTSKLITAVTLLHQIENNQLSIDKRISGQKAQILLQNMIVKSDNTAWQSLNTYLTHTTLQKYTTELGMTSYKPSKNTIAPADMVLLMTKLYNNQLLNKEHTDLLLSYMQQANKREYIVANIPTEYTVYHKAGWLDGLMHDVAIISNGQKTIVLAIYTYSGTNPGDTIANQTLFKDITAAAMTAYFEQ